MKKVGILLVLALTLIMILTACSSSTTPSAPLQVSSSTTQPSSSPAAQPVELIFSTPGPETLPEFTYKGATGPIKQAMADISTASGGKLTFKQYYGGSLTAAGTLWDALLTGSADLGVDQPSYNKGRFPLCELLELPWGYPNAVAASTIVWNTYKKFQPAELEGLTMLYTRSFGHPVIMSNVPIRKLSDLKGLRIRGTGNMTDVLSALGAAPVSMPIFEVYDAMRKGTIDGCLTGPDNFESMKLSEVAKYYIDVSFIANGMITTCMISTSKLNSLPAEYQKLIKDSVDKVNPAYWTFIEKTMTDGYAYADSKGLERTTISAEDQVQAQTLARQVADKYVSASKLSNAQEVVAFIQDAVKNYK